jgi:hypothetical protein
MNALMQTANAESPKDDASQSLQSLLAEDFDAVCFRPRLLSADGPEGMAALTELLGSGRVRAVHDQLEEQLIELVVARSPSLRSDHEAIRLAIDAVRGRGTRGPGGSFTCCPAICSAACGPTATGTRSPMRSSSACSGGASE